MPELPECETIVRDLRKEVEGKKVIFNKLIYDVNFKTPFYNLAGRIIERVERYGKYIIIKFDKTALMIHLSMAGHILLDTGETEIQKHCHWLIQLDDGWQIRFIDIRHFGKCWHMSYNDCIKYVQSKLGPEIWDLDEESFLLITRQPKYANRMIKELLLEQKYIAGIGNIYASEICYETFILPHTKVKDLRDSQIKQMYYNIKKVLEKAIKNNGTSFKDYRDAKNRTGNNQHYLRAYKQEQCKRCLELELKNKGPYADKEFPILKEKIKGRMSYWCPNCQK